MDGETSICLDHENNAPITVLYTYTHLEKLLMKLGSKVYL